MDWQAMALLGAYHGINPGMGWLFAVALGLQHDSAHGVWRALPPSAAGHAMSVFAVLATAGLAQLVVPPGTLDALVSAMLISMGLYRLRRHQHPRFGGMQVGFRDLTVWSFLMASAHGAGIMMLPFLMRTAPLSAAGHEHAHQMATATSQPAAIGAMAVTVHTLSYFIVMSVTAWLVYRKLGLNLLRTAWFNLDWLWAAALLVTGIGVLLIS